MSDPPPEPSFIANRFQVRRSLGEGGFGIVYEVLDLEQQAVIALKTLRESDSEGLYRLKARIPCACGHPALKPGHAL